LLLAQAVRAKRDLGWLDVTSMFHKNGDSFSLG